MLLTSQDLYRFDDFELDASIPLLKRNDAIVPLTPKGLDVLAHLVLNAGRVVTKEELFQAVWPDAFVEENNLNQHISALRKALGDKSGSIVTLPGRGYRFVAAVQVVHPVETLPESLPGDVYVQRVRQRTHLVIENAPQAALPGASAARRSDLRRWAAIAAVAGVLLALAAAYAWKRYSHPPQVSELVLAAFDNQTGDEAFDGALQSALQIGVEQTPYLHFVPRGKVRETLQKMQIKPGATLTLDLAREVCERNNAQAVLQGAIARIGNRYLITVSADSCVSGRRLASGKAEADSSDGVFAALDTAMRSVRRQIGESSASIERFQTPISQASTSSIEALRDYSRARDAFEHGDQAGAGKLLEDALALDPNFAAAYMSLGSVYTNRGDYAQASVYYKDAFNLRWRATERERLIIDIAYHIGGDFDTEEAIHSLLLAHQIYRADESSWGSLANLYLQLGQVDQAVDAGQQSLRINPHSGFGQIVLGEAYCKAGRFAEAAQVAQASIADHKDSWANHSTLLQVDFAQGNEAGVEAEADWGQSHGQGAQALYDYSRALAASGKMRQANESFARARTQALADHDNDLAEEIQASHARMLIDYGESAQATAILKTMNGDPAVPGEMALLEAQAGDLAAARPAAANPDARYPRHTVYLNYYLPMLRATLALADGKPADAVQLLEPARPYQLRDYLAIDLRAQAENAAGMLDAAAADYRLILANPGVDPISPLYSLAHLRLARVLALKNDKDGSRGEYKKFFAAWKNADADVPILQQARAEYARLK
jgi:DNA-binding winged helix-turn-helix (wHTH) protein/tetratricopeptide (TPR) repeat protein